MNLKKFFILAVIIAVFSCLVGFQQLDSANCKITEIRYHLYFDKTDPLLQVWLFLFSLCFSSQDFILRQKTINSEEKNFYELVIYNDKKEVARIFSLNGVFGGKVNICKYWTAEFDSAQAEFWFEVWEFIRSAEPEFLYRGNYRTSKNVYEISINAVRKELVETSSGCFETLYFNGTAWKKSGKHVDMKFWLAKGGEKDGLIVKFIIKKNPWAIIVEIL